MGKRVTFRRARQHYMAPADATGRLWNWGRVKFVPGQETTSPASGFVACGSATKFPMKVTPAQLMEIFYRVKDAKFSAGVIRRSDDYYRVEFQDGDLPSGDNVQELVDAWQVNTAPTYESCFLKHGSFTMIPGVDTAGIAEVAALGAFYGEPYYSYSSHYFADALADERVLFLDKGAVEFNLWAQGEMCGFQHEIITGYSGTPDAALWDAPPSSLYGFFYRSTASSGYAGADARVFLPNQVAWVKNSGGSDNPLDPVNDLWLALDVFVGGVDDFVVTDLTPYLEYEDPNNNTNAFEMELADDVVIKCDLWGISGEYVTTPIRIKATEWWPYATPVGLPAWDSDNGEAVNNVMDARLAGETFAALDLGMLSPQP